jgi:hypothetical protein
MQVYYKDGGSNPAAGASSAFGYSSSAAVPTEVLPLPDAALAGIGDRQEHARRALVHEQAAWLQRNQ